MKEGKNTTVPFKPPFRGVEILTHMVVWGIVLGLPYFFIGRQQQEVSFVNYLRSAIVLLSFMVVFYLNYLLLVERYLFAKHPGRFVLCNGVLVGAMLLFLQLFPHLILACTGQPDWIPRQAGGDWQDMVGILVVNAFLYLLVAGLSVAIKMTDSWYKTEAIRREAEQSRTEAELQMLKSQLNPHFLFNTLNNIYSLIAFSPERAQEAVLDLSYLLRYVLYESSKPFVPMEKELEFVCNYMDLMRMRLPEHVEVSTSIQEGITGVVVAPLLLISPIENAFKHGVGNNRPSFIRVDIRMEHGKVTCAISNSYFPKEAGVDMSGSGIGLQNLRRRLELIYPNRHRLSCGQEGDSYVSLLELDLS